MIWLIVLIVVILVKIYNPVIDFGDEDYIFIWYGRKDKRKNIKIKR